MTRSPIELSWTAKENYERSPKKTDFLDLLCERHPEKFFGTGKWLFGAWFNFVEGGGEFCKSPFFGTLFRNKSCFQAHSLNGSSLSKHAYQCHTQGQRGGGGPAGHCGGRLIEWRKIVALWSSYCRRSSVSYGD